MARRGTTLRMLSGLTAVGAMTLATGACGGGGNTTGSTSEGTGGGNSFTIGVPIQESGTSPYRTMIEKYQQASGAKVTVKELPNDGFAQAIRTQLQSGNAPDVFYVTAGSGDPQAVIPFAKAGMLAPLDATSAALIPESQKNEFTVDGKVYAQPMDIRTLGIVLNKGAADQAGVTMPKSFTELTATCQKLAGQGKSFIALAGKMPPNTGLSAMAIAAGTVYAKDPTWNTKRAAGQTTFAGTEGWKQALQAVVDMQKAGCFQKGVEGAGFDAITSGLGQGTSLAGFLPGQAAADLMGGVPGSSFVLEPFPNAAGGNPELVAAATSSLAVYAKAKNPDAAKKFLDWLGQPANATEFAKASGGIPITGIKGATLPAQYADIKTQLESGEFVSHPNLSWSNGEVYTALGTGVQGLLTGQTTVDGVLQSMDTAWDKK